MTTTPSDPSTPATLATLATLATVTPEAIASLTQSVDLVKQMIKSGLLDPADLELAPIPHRSVDVLPRYMLVPGEPIKIRDLVAKTKRGLSKATGRTYGTYLDLVDESFPRLRPGMTPQDQRCPGRGERWAHEVLPSELEAIADFVQDLAVERAAARAAIRESVGRAPIHSDGLGARYNAVGAMRRMFAVAIKDRHLAKPFNPAQEVKKPRRGTGNRRPLTGQQMPQFWAVVRGTGNDPELDERICQTILIAGARREGLLNLTVGGIDVEECTLRLDEKFGKVTLQPVPDWFAVLLRDFAVARGATRPSDPVFRTRPTRGRPSRPITSRRLDNLFQRVQSMLGWADKAQVTAHTLRHHAIGLVERIASKQVAMAFARHEPDDTTALYGRASAREVAQAVITLHGGAHPWLPGDEEE